MNAVEEIANAVGITRGGRNDATLALDVLQTLYRTWQRTNRGEWVHDREENTYELHTDTCLAYVARSKSLHAWVYFVARGNKIICEGHTSSAVTALEICSLATA